MMSDKDFFVSLERVWSESPNSLQTHKEIFAWCYFSKKLYFLKKMGPNSKKNMRSQLFFEFFWVVERIFFQKKLVNAYFFLSLERWFPLKKKQTFFFWKMTSSKDFFVSLEWVWSQTLPKLTPNSLQTHMFPFFSFFFYFTSFLEKGNEFGSKLICFLFFSFFLFYFFLKKRNEFSPNSYVFICLLFIFFGQEEWVWSEFGDSPNWPQIRSKFICVHVFSILLFFWKEEWVWSEFGDYPNSLQTHSKLDPNSNDFMFYCVFPLLFFHFCLEKTNDFGASLENLQTRSKLICFQIFLFFLFFSIYYYFTFLGKGERVWSEFGDSPNSPQTQMISIFCCVFSLYCYLKHFLGREEWAWSKFGGSSNSLQNYSKLAPNSYGFILLFFLYCQLIVFFHFFEKGMSFHFLYWIFLKKKKWIWRFPKVSPISLRALVATPLGPEITYSGRCFIGTYQINLVNAYHPERLSSCKLSVQMSKKCTPLWREAHFQVKSVKNWGVRSTFWTDVEKVHPVVARSTFRSQNVKNIRGSDHFWRFRCRFASFRFKHYTTLHYTTLHYTTVHYTTLHSTTLQLQLHNYTPLHSITLHYTKLHYTTFHYTTLHYTTLHYTEWHCTTDRQIDRQTDRYIDR